MKKICVCGRSKQFPVCDNSHTAEDWSCASNLQWVELGFCASYSYQNIATKLASHHKGAALSQLEPSLQVGTLILLVDGADLELPLRVYRQLPAARRLLFSLGVGSSLLQKSFPEAELFDLSEPHHAFARINDILHGKAEPTPKKELSLRSAFLSHAVADEPLLSPAVEYLRAHFGASLFTCADSIPVGVDWQSEIIGALRSRELFVMLLSEATLRSHFCSFEIGLAYALQKPMALLSLDGARPPAFIQHLQVIDLARIAKQKPWLSTQDILLIELVNILAG